MSCQDKQSCSLRRYLFHVRPTELKIRTEIKLERSNVISVQVWRIFEGPRGPIKRCICLIFLVCAASRNLSGYILQHRRDSRNLK